MKKPDINEILDLAHNRDNFNKLYDLYYSGRVIPYIGAGLSVFANKIFKDKFYTWRAFVDKCSKKYLKKKLIQNADLYDVTDEICKMIGKEQFYTDIADCYGYNLSDEDWNTILDKAKGEAISKIPQLFNGPIITTNFDQILEKLYSPPICSILPNDENLSEKVDNIRKHRKLSLYKVHGCVSDINNIVFTGESYKLSYAEKSYLVKTLSRLYPRFSFLFLGSSLQMTENQMDKSIKLWTQLKGTGMYHFAIIEATDNLSERERELKEQSIFPIFYPKGQHHLISIILNELLERKHNQVGVLPEYKSPFVGMKSEMSRIDKYFKTQDIYLGSRIFVICGEGGVGKTRVMREYALIKKRQTNYKRIIWLNAISRSILISDISQILLKYGIVSDNDKKEDEELIAILENWIYNDDTLILLDNVEDFNDISDILAIKSCNTALKKHFIITTRPDKTHNYEFIKITGFTDEDAQKYFYTYTHKPANVYSQKIANKLDLLPLAIEQAASYILKNEKKIGYENYWVLLCKSYDILNDGTTESRTHSVMATWNLSMQMIDNEAAQFFLNVCSNFAPNNIRYSWFKKGISQLKSCAVLYDNINDNARYDKMISDLADYSLIRRDRDTFSIHHILYECIKRSCESEKNIWASLGIGILWRQIFNKFTTQVARNKFIQLAPHIDAILIRCNDNISKKMARLSHFMMYGLEKLNKYQNALAYEKETICRIKSAYGNYGEKLASTYNLIGVIYMNMGNYSKAETNLKKALEIRIKNENLYLARTNDNLGILCYFTCRYKESEDYHMKALMIKESLKKSKKMIKESTYTQNNLGALYDKMAQRYNNEALNIHYKVLENRKINNDEDKAFTLHNIGVIYENLGNYPEALSYLKQALGIRNKIYKNEPMNPNLAQTRLHIANIYLNKEMYNDAWNLLIEVKKAFEETYGCEHTYTKKVYFSFAKYYYYQELYNDAMAFLKLVSINNIDKNDSINMLEINKMIEKCNHYIIEK